MHDIRAIRENPEAYERAWNAKGLSGRTEEILALDAKLRAAQTAVQQAQAERNDASKKIGQAKARKDEAEASRLMAHVEALKKTLEEQGAIEREAGEALRGLTSRRPTSRPARTRAATWRSAAGANHSPSPTPRTTSTLARPWG
jgi:seryl-tRNA synthetase